MPRAQNDWTIAHADEALVAAHTRSLLVLSWRTGADVSHVERVAELQRTLVREGKGPLSVLNMFSLESAGGIPDELRTHGRALYEEMSPHYFAQAYVVLGEGFWAAGIRAFLAAFNVLTARRLETKTVARIEDAVTWMSTRPGQAPWMQSAGTDLAADIEDLVVIGHTTSAVA